MFRRHWFLALLTGFIRGTGPLGLLMLLALMVYLAITLILPLALAIGVPLLIGRIFPLSVYDRTGSGVPVLPRRK